ncbi:hypothetical protein [Lewinella sp. IMCC34183]|uniref:hypothetical protein n=1 Tax=Lewinella sp. IMCC34183 TaxID=2248762 RepID=UPI0013006359|nr:hypothetical protein [Lewinella sp. IMCC34183]
MSYQLHWDMTQNAGNIHLRLADDSVVTVEADHPGKLVVWVDLLRNDTPVFYWRNGEKEGLASGWESLPEADDHSQDGQA